MPPARLAIAPRRPGCRPARQHRGQRGDHGVARAGHVEHFARLRRHVQVPPRVNRRHALFRAGQQQARRGRARRAGLLRLGRQLRLRCSSCRPPARNSARLGVSTVAPAYASKVARPWVDQHRSCRPRGARAIMRATCDQPALAVVGQHDDVVAGSNALKSAQLVAQHVVARALLEIDPQQLLLAADHAQLDRGRDRGVVMQAAAMPLVAAAALHLRAGLVVPTTASRPLCAPSAAALRATLAAPPRRSSRCSIRTTGTGASGEMRLPRQTSNGPASRRRHHAGMRTTARPASGAAEGVSRFGGHASAYPVRSIHHVEFFGAPRRVGFPLAASRTLPIELARLETAMAALVTRQLLRIAVHQVLAPWTGRTRSPARRIHQARFEHLVQAQQGRGAAQFVTHQFVGSVHAVEFDARP